MGGRGPRFSPGTEVLDSLAAQAVVIEDGKGLCTLWISIDMIGMAWQKTSGFRQELSAMTGIPFEAIVINFSHTHSGPMSGFEGYATMNPKPPELEAYESDLLTRCIKMVMVAIEQMREVRVTAHRGTSDIGINRRLLNPEGEIVMAPNPDGYYNADLWVLNLETTSQDDRCVLFNYGCHPVMIYGFAWDGISADFPGVCRNRLVSELGPNTQAQFIQGFAGNVRPRQLADLENRIFRKSVADDVVVTGNQLAEDVLSALSSEGHNLVLDLSFASDFAMTPRDHTVLPELSHWGSLAESDEEVDRNLGIYWRDRLRSGIPPVQFLPWAVGLIRLAPGHTIAWMANEVLAEWLPLLREWLDDPELVGWGYCQDGRNYMPTDGLIGEGGYEVDRANTYSKNGPGPVATGINEVTKKVFQRLAVRMGVVPSKGS